MTYTAFLRMTDEQKLYAQFDRTQDAFPSPGKGDEAAQIGGFTDLPRTIGRYNVVALLGRGAMGSVHLAFDTELERHVALKVFSSQMSSHPDARQRFAREAQAAAALNHPGICAIHSIERLDGILFLVLEYVKGRSFRQLLDDPSSGWPPKPRLAAGYILQVADALRAAHAAGIIHRDVKGSNLMCSVDGRVKILDFGLAKVDGSHLLTHDGSVVGTPAYISPEQAQGDEVDARTDLWSLGVVFYEILTGRLPFPEHSIAALTHAILNHEPPPVKQIRPDLPAPFGWVIQKLLAKKREQRYSSAAALMAELTPLVEPGLGDSSSRNFIPTRSSVTGSRAGMESILGTLERRAVTFLQIELSSVKVHPDPEDFEAALEESRELCSRIVSQHHGYIQAWIGNTVSVCFGFPNAQEGAARLAVSSGIAMADAFARSQTGFCFKGGIETALVVADTSHAKPLTGEGLELARSLCGSAKPNQLLVGPEARRQTEGRFQFGSEQELDLPGGRKLGFAPALHASTARSRFHAIPASALTPLLGRDQEMQLLVRRWEDAIEGHGSVILLGGAPGLGKSRLTYELKRSVAQDSSAALIECFCAPQYSNTALYPVIECFDRLVFERDGKPMDLDEKLRALEGTLTELGFSLPETLPLFAFMLGVPVPEGTQLEVTPERRRTLTLEALVHLLVERASRQPLLFIVEDLHWADPTTLELLGMLVDQLAAVPLLALYTHRPEYSSTLPQRSHVSSISLNRLSRADSIQMVSAASRNSVLDSGTRDQIIGNSDGVPLFLEEMTKTVVESGGNGETHAKIRVPANLRDSFVARLDQLGPARNVARVAAILGREFPESLLEAISELSQEELRQNLDRLVEAEVLYVRTSGRRRVFIFKHALLQEAAYESLLRKSRTALHARAADLVVNRFSDIASREPETVARHFTEAGLGLQAISYWHKAGIAALQRSAYQEAISQLRSGLEVFHSLPEASQDPSHELLLLTTMGPALLATQGFGAIEVGETYKRAEQLIDAESNSSLVLPALWGVWVYSLVRSNLQHAQETATKMVSIGERFNNSAMLLEGHWTAGNTLFWSCDLLAARRHLELAEGIYGRENFQSHAYLFGQDSLVATLCYQSFVYCFLGLFDQALQASQHCVDHAKALRHPFSIGWSLTFRATVHFFLGSYLEAQDLGDQAVKYCQEQAYPFWISAAMATCGRSVIELGSLKRGTDLLRQAIFMTRMIGSRVIEPLYRGMLAEAMLIGGDASGALAEVEGAIEQADLQGVGISRLDLLRIRGVVLNQLNRAEESEIVLRQCVSESQAAHSRLTQLRAAVHLAELFGDHATLGRVLESFPPASAEPPVLRDARAVYRRK